MLHLAGERDFPELDASPARGTTACSPSPTSSAPPSSAADLVVARAGGSVWEVAAAGKPALLVPYPHATADHQAKNARYFERGGGAVVVPKPSSTCGRQVEELLGDPERLARMARGDAARWRARLPPTSSPRS